MKKLLIANYFFTKKVRPKDGHLELCISSLTLTVFEITIWGIILAYWGSRYAGINPDFFRHLNIKYIIWAIVPIIGLPFYFISKKTLTEIKYKKVNSGNVRLAAILFFFTFFLIFFMIFLRSIGI